MNLIEVMGFLGADAEERFTPSGKRVVELRVAAKVRQGGQDETMWWKCTVWDERIDRLLPYLKKGSAVIVVGEMLLPETYVAKDGSTRVSLSMRLEMVKFSPFGKPDREKENSSYSSSTPQQSAESGQGQEMASAGFSGSEGFTGDDLPF